MKKLRLLLLTLFLLTFPGCGNKPSIGLSGPGLGTPEVYTPKSTNPSPSASASQEEAEPPKAEIFAELDAAVTSGILFDGAGNMLVGRDGGIVKINSNGEVSTFCSFDGITPKKHYFFKSPLVWDMVLDNDGSILAAAQDRIMRISKSGEITTIAEDSFDGFVGASGIELDNDNNIYFTNGSHIVKISPEGGQTIWLDGSSSGLSSFFSLKFDADKKNLYATDFNTSTLVKIRVNKDGNPEKPTLIVREPLKNAKPYGAPLNMAFGSDGTLYSSLDCRSQLLLVDQSDKTSFLKMLCPADNHFIAFGGNGFDSNAIYFTTYSGKRIYRFLLP